MRAFLRISFPFLLGLTLTWGLCLFLSAPAEATGPTMPNVVGMTLSQAKAALAQAGLSLSGLRPRSTPDRNLDQKVFAQTPEPGKPVGPVTLDYYQVVVNPPAPPSKLTATAIGVSGIRLYWADNSNDEEGFRIDRKTGISGAYAPIYVTSANANTYLDSTCKEDTTYYYRVIAFNKIGGYSGPSNEASTTTPPILMKPPSELSAKVISPSRIDLTWKANSNANSVVGFSIKRTNSEQQTKYFDVGKNIISYSDNNLDTVFHGIKGFTYEYSVTTKYVGGFLSGESNKVRVKPLLDPPKAPPLLSPANGSGISNQNPKLVWSTTGGAFSWDLQVSIDPQFKNNVIEVTWTTSYFDIVDPWIRGGSPMVTVGPKGGKMLNRNNTYYWRVKAMNWQGYSPWSDVWSFKIK